MAALGSLKSAVFDGEERRMHYRTHIRGLTAYDRHKKFMNDYARFYGSSNSSEHAFPVKTDHDTIREGFRFIVSEEDDMDSSWEKRLVKHYYDKLFKEYCIADLSGYKKGKSTVVGVLGMLVEKTFVILIGLRWRLEKEVISGKGQFICGNKQCNNKDGLGSYEVNFSYVEAGENKQALVKLVVCNRCAEKLVYKRHKDKEKLLKKDEEIIKTKRKRGEYDDDICTSEGYKMSPDVNKKAQKATSSKGAREDDDKEFDQLLEGMFP